MIESLPIEDARKLVLLSQGLPPAKGKRNSQTATLAALERLGYVQIDTISVVERAHHHTLWNRNPRYKPEHLDQLVLNKKVFEYWSHAAAYLPFRDYRYTLPRKRSIAEGQLEHWYERDQPLMNKVLDRIRHEGPLMAKDFENAGKRIGEWRIKPAKRALESLFMEGKLMISRRKNFHKVYDLTERVLPSGVDTTIPDAEEYARFLITRFLKANGLGQASEIAYLLKGTKMLISRVLKDMVSSGELSQVKVADKIYHVFPEALKFLDQPMIRGKVNILSPFDNLVIQRKRLKALFGFDYLMECYLPESKRQFGYFVLPILWDGKLVARMDCKADRLESVLHIHHLVLESTIKDMDSFLEALLHELKSFMQFNHCSNLQLHKTAPTKIRTELARL